MFSPTQHGALGKSKSDRKKIQKSRNTQTTQKQDSIDFFVILVYESEKIKTSNNEKSIKMIKILLILCVILFSAHATPAKTKSMRFRRKSQPAYVTTGAGKQWGAVRGKWESLKSSYLGPKATETSAAMVRKFSAEDVQPYVLFCSERTLTSLP